MEEKDRKRKPELKKILRNFFEGTYIVEYAFITYNKDLLIIMLNIDLTVWIIEDVKQKIQNITGQYIGYENILESYNRDYEKYVLMDT